jgi:hypothetical protein
VLLLCLSFARFGTKTSSYFQLPAQKTSFVASVYTRQIFAKERSAGTTPVGTPKNAKNNDIVFVVVYGIQNRQVKT